MTTPTTKAPSAFQVPPDADVVGPQNEAERRLYELVMEGINSGPSPKTSVAALAEELRARIRPKR
ncbi:hypothetical protein H3H37_19855 [Duganella sp. LX20W]|uniref:Uncharacterized protein n=1 Tax=Rugamonas brunnea TaxID=2758569 RepID=A0A7W2EVF8_9BURK|nr:hypothetical protein [Rugamonas brunnea]MBA5639320.1 hypothetical protein [Rugamonas brunnea]